jgi:hypothetical protein
VRSPPSPRALCAPSTGVGSDMWAGSARLGPRRAKPSGSVVGPRRLSAYCVLAGRAHFQPDGRLKIEIIFHFYFDSNANSNFKILYLNIQSSKNYEISSVGFIIF